MNALIILAVLGIVMMFSGVWIKKASVIRSIAIAGMVAALAANLMESHGFRFFAIDTSNMLAFTRFSLFANSLFLAGTVLYFLLTAKEMELVGNYYADYFALIFFIHCGIVLTLSFQSLLILFLGIEIISIPLYILTGADKRNLKSNEASLKYFLMGAFSTGLMLMGIALVYGANGTFSTVQPPFGEAGPSPLLIVGMFLLLFSMSFKVSVAPFHFWTPDVYDGAPTVFTSFMATIVKGAVFIGFIRLFGESFVQLRTEWKIWVAILVAITLFIGNLTAVFQQSVKRMLAYSSIAQAGFMLMAIFALNTAATEGLFLYIAAYSLATIGIFAILTKIKDYTFDGFNGFAKKEPVLAATLAVFLFSLAGIPLTAGFLAKLYMIKAALATPNGLWLALFAILMATVSVYYYFRLLQSMYFKEGDAGLARAATPLFKWTLIVMAALIILIGIFPNLLLNWFYF